MSFFVFLGDDYRRLPLFPLRDVSTEHSPTVHCCTPHKRCRSGHCICICFCVCICICNYIRILYLTYLDVNAPQAGMGLSLIMNSPILSLPCLVVAGFPPPTPVLNNLQFVVFVYGNGFAFAFVFVFVFASDQCSLCLAVAGLFSFQKVYVSNLISYFCVISVLCCYGRFSSVFKNCWWWRHIKYLG